MAADPYDAVSDARSEARYEDTDTDREDGAAREWRWRGWDEAEGDDVP